MIHGLYDFVDHVDFVPVLVFSDNNIIKVPGKYNYFALSTIDSLFGKGENLEERKWREGKGPGSPILVFGNLFKFERRSCKLTWQFL